MLRSSKLWPFAQARRAGGVCRYLVLSSCLSPTRALADGNLPGAAAPVETETETYSRGDAISAGTEADANSQDTTASAREAETASRKGAPQANDEDGRSQLEAAYRGAQCLIEHKHYREAQSLLKAQLEVIPDSRDLKLLLAAAYLGDHNPFWAIRTLAPQVNSLPDDCELRIWLAWAYLDLGDTSRSVELVDHASCRGPNPLAARAALIRALIARARGQSDVAASELEAARKAPGLFPGDLEAFSKIASEVESDRIPELTWKFEAREGYTSNALLGSPTDPNRPSNLSGISTASVFYQLTSWIRLSPKLKSALRPSLELEARVFQLSDPDLSQQSYVNPSARIGTFIGERLPRTFVGYRPDYLQLAGGDSRIEGRFWYMGGHRAEVETEFTPWLLGFIGVGRRDFRPIVRNRYEADGGLGGQLQFTPQLGLIWAVSLRKHWSDSGVYDLLGATGLANLKYDLPGGWRPRIGINVAVDDYASSRGYFSDQARRDGFVKSSVVLWSPELEGWRAGWSYDYAHRDSTASLYDFDDHRITMMLSWSGSADFTRVTLQRSHQQPSANIEWGLKDGTTSRVQERVQDYLREDERTLQRACGCRE